MNNATVTQNDLPNDEVVKRTTLEKLEALELSKAWMAKQIGVSEGYLRRVLAGAAELTRALKEKLWAFNKKLEQIGMILQAA